MLFTSFPRLRGGVYKGLGAFLRGVVVGIFFLFTHTPPFETHPLPFIFYALEKQNWNKKTNQTNPISHQLQK